MVSWAGGRAVALYMLFIITGDDISSSLPPPPLLLFGDGMRPYLTVHPPLSIIHTGRLVGTIRVGVVVVVALGCHLDNNAPPPGCCCPPLEGDRIVSLRCLGIAEVEASCPHRR